MSSHACAAVRTCTGCQGNIVCNIFCDPADLILKTLGIIGPTLCVMMFIYGGVKYAFSADDPAGRKAGKMTCIHSIIGGVLLLLVDWVLTMISGDCGTCT
jgi:hypothetical protein